MLGKRKQFSTLLSLLTTLMALQLVPTAISVPKLVPSDYSKLKSWVDSNIKDFNKHTSGKGPPIAIDARLANAEEHVKVITVAKEASGRADFRTITDAVNSIPEKNLRRTIIWIGGGEYREKITIKYTKPFITFYGDPNDMPTIVYDGTAAEYGTIYSATVAVESNYFMAVNIAFVNSAPKPDMKKEGAQAVAMRISGDKAAFHNCKFVGFQDTLCDHMGRHFFKDCYIRGTVDFIFGNGKSLYLNSTIESVEESIGWITAHARNAESDESGFIFVHCNITGTGNNTYLGRAWMDRPRVVFAYTRMGTLINPLGWSSKYPRRDRTVYYGEYKCKGPGSSSSGRVSYAKRLSDEEAKPFLSMSYIQGNRWLLSPPYFNPQTAALPYP